MGYMIAWHRRHNMAKKANNAAKTEVQSPPSGRISVAHFDRTPQTAASTTKRGVELGAENILNKKNGIIFVVPSEKGRNRSTKQQKLMTRRLDNPH